ncbi:hypothetical protein F5146DRAFT_1005606 [Armillaria mellea]|nr:hypothetical protein F5146DRAFT_1005606 [Armillaria mellea]
MPVDGDSDSPRVLESDASTGTEVGARTLAVSGTAFDALTSASTDSRTISSDTRAKVEVGARNLAVGDSDGGDASAGVESRPEHLARGGETTAIAMSTTDASAEVEVDALNSAAIDRITVTTKANAKVKVGAGQAVNALSPILAVTSDARNEVEIGARTLTVSGTTADVVTVANAYARANLTRRLMALFEHMNKAYKAYEEQREQMQKLIEVVRRFE